MKNVFLLLIGFSLFLILYSYFFYPALLFVYSKLRRSVTPGKLEDKDLPRVSVVIAAHNEEKVIEDKIRNTLELDYPRDKIEILIGSDGSDDKTDEICMRHLDHIIFERIEPRQGKPNVLNTLVENAGGEILLFTDANTMLEKKCLTKMVCHMMVNSVGAVCGRLILKSKGQGLESYEKLYWSYESKMKEIESRVFSTFASNGAIYAVRKELFRKIPVQTIIDDFWISLDVLEQGKRILFEKDARAYEYVSDNIVDEFWRKVRIGSGCVQTFTKRPFIRNQCNPFIHFAYYSHKVIRWIVPFLLILLYFMILILSSDPVYFVAFHVCNFFLFVAALGVLLDIRIKILSHISYFTLFNFALLYGYVRYVIGKGSVIWRRAER